MPKVKAITTAIILVCSADTSFADDSEETIEIYGHSIASGYDTYGTQRWSISFDEQIKTPTSLVDVLGTLPGVGMTESAGLIQTVSIRGVGRQGVLMMLDGIPIVTNRRAGTGLHFIDPLLLSDAQLLSGPSSAVYGAGALGGVVNVTPRQMDGYEIGVHYTDNGRSWQNVVGVGNGEHTLMVARLNAHNSEAADDTELNDHATRNNVLYRGEHRAEWGRIEWLAAPSQIRDMGRVANDPRITSAPEEDHLPLRIAAQFGAFETALSFYSFDAITNIENPDGSAQRTNNEARQWFWNAQHTTSWDRIHWVNGLSLAKRDKVRAEEISVAVDGSETTSVALPEGDETVHSLFSALTLQYGAYAAHLGIRHAQQEQSALGYANTDESDTSISFGNQFQFSDTFTVSLSYSNGVRFAALTERYYDGVTPRGRTIGNADLKPEDAEGVELGLIWHGAQWQLSAHVYQQHIENYIERVRLSPPTPRRFTYQNLTEGKIKGAELQWQQTINDQWSWRLLASSMHAESDQGVALAGIPSNRVQGGFAFTPGDCRYALNWNWRATHDQIGTDEIELASTNYGDISAQCEVAPHWQFGATLSNASDELYLLNADVTAGLARGRSLSFSVVYR